MVSELFANLSRAVEGPAGIALAAAFLWGILSVILSPCHLGSIPLIVAYVNQQGRISTRRAFSISAVFSLGILLTIALIGAVTAALGRMAGDVGKWGNYFVAFVFFAVGLYLLDVINVPWTGPGMVNLKKQGLFAALLLGLIFGVAVGPCTFAYMAPILGVSIKTAGSNPVLAVSMVLVYGLGHCSVIILAGTFTELVQKYLNFSERTRYAVYLKKACGVLILLAGLYMVYTA